VDLLTHALLDAWAGAGYGGELPVSLDCAALALFAGIGLAVAAPLLGREGGVTRTAFRVRRLVTTRRVIIAVTPWTINAAAIPVRSVHAALMSRGAVIAAGRSRPHLLRLCTLRL